MANEVSFSARVYRSGRSFSIPKYARTQLGIHSGDSVHLVVERPQGHEMFRGRKTLMSGSEIYGRDISSALEPGSQIFVVASDPRTLEADSEAEGLALQERTAGFQSGPSIRITIEMHAMDIARRELSKLGFVDFDDTSAHACYDYTCKKEGKLFYVEVKGTQGAGKSVILTPNEVEHAKKYEACSIAVIVRKIKIDHGTGAASGGTARIFCPWKIADGGLQAIQYMWTTPP